MSEAKWNSDMINMGMKAKVLLELHEKDPGRFSSEMVLEALHVEYVRLGLEPMEGEEE
ncbi:hypothetical protein ANABIO32_00540 [Rossellomorea marisflavi]|uniref:hypothetical protein n=1 Tax=Rossellomorea marisflavi TaxID=189381 RepID=UPI0025C80C14|nr:hypothetical protein [Rossellomorea marisflavi]GLI82368.1 hypothetical protein ANABIO32_00540 [Rossellomorea marisflavi]